VFLTESRSQELRVPVRSAEVELRTDLEHTLATVFLPPDRAFDNLFEDDTPFFPAQAGGRMRFYARASVVSISIAVGDTASDSVESFGVPLHARAVTVRLRSGAPISGTLACERGRTLDFLNQAAKCFTVRADRKLHIIAKAHVECIEEVQ
jgi:hypothetical protein